MSFCKITIGADPELFIINTKTNKVVSAVGLIPGVKGKPYRPKGMPKGFGIETDNILAEFNIPSVKCKEDFINNIYKMKNYIDKFVKNINPDLGILCTASQEVPDSELESDQAKEFGCMPDYNVYTEKSNPKPCGATTNIRSCGFHIHCGYPHNNIKDSLIFIKYFDSYLGVPSVLRDPDTKRRSLYGKAGCFRLTPYGFEYRSLSSALMSSMTNLEFVWNQIEKAVYAWENDLLLPPSELVQKAINDSDASLAKKLIISYSLE